MKISNLLKLTVLSLFMLSCASSDNEVSAQDSTSAEVVLTEYSDYQCPACAYFHPIVNKLEQEFGDRLHVEYRYFPLNGHQFGALSARAVQAARNQGKFKEMHDLLFENQQHWVSSGNPQPIFVNYAQQLGLDVEQFREDLNSAETQRIVMEDKQQGQAEGVNATPTFFINGDKLAQNPPTYEQFRALINSYMKDAK
jgi:protein-disulfide isomerase